MKLTLLYSTSFDHSHPAYCGSLDDELDLKTLKPFGSMVQQPDNRRQRPSERVSASIARPQPSPAMPQTHSVVQINVYACGLTDDGLKACGAKKQ